MALSAPTTRLDSRVVNHGGGQGSGNYTSSSFTTVAGSLLVAFIQYDWQTIGSGAGNAASIPTPVTSGLTWVKVASIYSTDQFVTMQEVWVADCGSSGSKTIAQTGTGQFASQLNAIDVCVLEFATGAKAAASQAGATASLYSASGSPRDPAAQTLTLSASPASGSCVLAGYAGDTDGSATTTPGSGWTEISETDSPPGGPFLHSQRQFFIGLPSTSVDWVDVSSTAQVYCFSTLAYEVQEAVADPVDVVPVGTIVSVVAAVAAVAGTGAVTPDGTVVTVVSAVASIATTPEVHAAGAVVSVVSATATVTGTANVVPDGTVVAVRSAVASITIPSAILTPRSVAGRKLLDPNGDVVFAHDCAIWFWPQNRSDADNTDGLEKIAAAGIPSVLVTPCGGYYGSGWDRFHNLAGDPFFLPDNGNVSATLGDAWDSVLHIFAECQRLGLWVSYSGVYVGFGSPSQGIGDALIAAGTTVAYNYGAAVADLLEPYWDIMMLHTGFDTNPGPSMSVVEAYWHGFTDTVTAGGGPAMLGWIEPSEGHSAYDQGFFSATYMPCDINTTYVYEIGGTNPGTTIADNAYNEAGATSYPVMDCEPPYDGHGGRATSPQNLRERIMTGAIRGLIGINWGNDDIWTGDKVWSGGSAGGSGATDAALDSETLLDAGRCFTFLRTYARDATWEPSDVIVSGGSSGETEAAGGNSDTVALVYVCTTGTITVDTTILPGSDNVRIRWWDPTDGTYDSVATSEAPNPTRAVTPPGDNSQGDDDWVLVVETIQPAVVNAHGTVVLAVSGEANVTGTGAVHPDGTVAAVVSAVAAVTAAVVVSGTGTTAAVVSAEATITATGAVSPRGAVVAVRTAVANIGATLGVEGATAVVNVRAAEAAITATTELDPVPTVSLVFAAVAVVRLGNIVPNRNRMVTVLPETRTITPRPQR